jgi:nicotinamidase-related amidase
VQTQRLAAVVLGIVMLSGTTLSGSSLADEFKLHLRSQHEAAAQSGKFERTVRDETWVAAETAVIVCDVWDYHHCLNAVRRMKEFLPRMNDFVKEARHRGATIIHAPSDCMRAYERNPARERAIEAPEAKSPPQDIEFWCSRIPAEKSGVYPIDQSDGGEDDDPAEHAEWAAKLELLGRNPAMPWKHQSNKIEIDSKRDFISDRGLEVWNVLESRGIKNVILVGVHTNMCVLGRPFGLRQMARNGKRVALVRDLTDCMYNPRRWPYVDHFTGNDLIASHTERYICPTFTSDQLLGGTAFRFKFDKREMVDITDIPAQPKLDREIMEKEWSLVSLPSDWKTSTQGVLENYEGVGWFRCSVRIPKENIGENHPLSLGAARIRHPTFWLNGQKLTEIAGESEIANFLIDQRSIIPDDINLLVARIDFQRASPKTNGAPVLHLSDSDLPLKGRWQFRLGDNPTWSNIPLPAKFGASPDILFEP